MLGMGRLSGERRRPGSEERRGASSSVQQQPAGASSDQAGCVEIDMRQNPGLAQSARLLVLLSVCLAVITPTWRRWSDGIGMTRPDLEFAPPLTARLSDQLRCSACGDLSAAHSPQGGLDPVPSLPCKGPTLPWISGCLARQPPPCQTLGRKPQTSSDLRRSDQTARRLVRLCLVDRVSPHESVAARGSGIIALVSTVHLLHTYGRLSP